MALGCQLAGSYPSQTAKRGSGLSHSHSGTYIKHQRLTLMEVRVTIMSAYGS
jgi:hypothetical protein